VVSSSSRLTASLLAAIVALLALGASVAAAAPKEIAYRCTLDICLIDPDNPAAIVNLTDNEGLSFDESPAWSPDGKRLAFVSNFSDGTRNVFVMEPEAPGQSVNGALQITHYKDGGYLNDPVWSPDGSRILATRGTEEGSRSIVVANADGTTVTPVVVTEHGQHPSWAPDGGKVAYSYGPQVYLKNADGSGVATPLANGQGKEPAWSPDGTRIAFDTKEFGNLAIASSSGAGTPALVPLTSQWSFATWSPDGGRIAYRATDNNDGYFHIVNADGSGDRPLIHVQEVNGYNAPASWSPDGSRIVYEGFHYNEPGHPFKLELENTNGTGSVVSLAEGDEPVWRPNVLVTPHVPVITPSGGSAGPLPGPTQPPKRVWITKRIPWNEAPYVPMLSVGCSAPVCNVGGTGTSKGVVYPGVHPRTGGLAAVSVAKPKPKKPKPVVVGKIVKTKVLGGQTKTVKMKLTAAGIKLLKELGKLTIDVKLTIASPGQATLTEHHKVSLYVKAPKKKSAK